jgi:hypothetical protein
VPFYINKQIATPAARQALEDLAAQHEAGGGRADARVARLARLIQEHRSLAKVLNDFTSSLERHAGPGARVTPGCQARAQPGEQGRPSARAWARRRPPPAHALGASTAAGRRAAAAWSPACHVMKRGARLLSQSAPRKPAPAAAAS